MKNYDTEEICKEMWGKYLKKNNPPVGVPREPEKHYGKHWKGWIYFLIGVCRKIENEKCNN